MTQQQPSVLIVDDEPNVRRAIRRVLRNQGWLLVEAGNGIEALKMMQNNDISLVISDLKMPEMDGVQLLRQVAVDYPLTARMLTSANADLHDLTQAINGGEICHFIPKPWTNDQLLIETQRRMSEIRRQRCEQHEQQAMSAELAMAASLQRASLPAPIQDPRFQIDWLFRTCTTLGGDGLGYRLRDGRLEFYLLDVVGHGLPAALESFALQQMLANTSMNEPANVARAMGDNYIYKDDPMRYFTMICGHLDLDSYQLTFCQAGHPSPVIVRDNEVLTPGVGGYPIGLIDGVEFNESSFQLQAGDLLLLHSDGFVEGIADVAPECLQKTLLNLRTRPMQHIIATLSEWRAGQVIDDDISAIALTLT